MKKIITALTSLVLCVGAVFSVASCKPKCAHNVGTWEVITEATCTNSGLQKGTCGICYETVEEVIPADPEAHVYGEWNILLAPTETEEGSASNTCTENGAHTLTVDLPVLGSREYKSSITLRPTAGKDGERTYTLKHDAGDVQFTQPIPKDGVQTIRDAVGLGASDESKELVRSATGRLGYQFVDEGVEQTTITDWSYTHEYEVGEDYTYSVEEDLKTEKSIQRWYFKDENGKLYGLTDSTMDGSGKIANDLATGNGDKAYMDGCRIFIPYYGGANTFGESYGVEDFLDKLYRSARMSTNDDFTETIVEEEGQTVYSFSFGDAKNSGSGSSYYTITTTSFTLTSDFVVKDLKVQCVNYVNNAESGFNTWKFNENGIARVNEGKENTGARYLSCVEFEQTLKAVGDTIPENPHTTDKMFVESFDIVYSGGATPVVLTEEGFKPDGTRSEFASNTTDYIFKIDNISPSSALEKYMFDSFGVYLRTKENGKVVDKLINESTELTTGVTMFMNANKGFFLNSKQAWEQTVVVKTSTGVERLIQCKIGAAEPSKLHASVYEYSSGKYTWMTSYDGTTVQQTSNTYQEFVFTAEVPVAEKNYASSQHWVKITDRVGKTVVNTQDESTVHTDYKNLSWFIASSRGGKEVSVFAPTVAGTYTITLTSTLKQTRTAKITLTVVDAPTFEALTMKSATEGREYASLTALPSLSYADLTFADFAETEDAYTVVAVITVSGTTTKLTCTYDKSERELTSTPLSGDYADKMTLSLNDGSDFVLSYYSQYGENETVVMRAVPDEE